MSTFSEMQERLEVTDGRLYWRAKGLAPKQLAGNKHGEGTRLKFNCKDYLKASVILALTHRDERLLELVAKAPKTPKPPKVATELRELLAKVSNRDDLLAVYRTIELLEAA